MLPDLGAFETKLNTYNQEQRLLLEEKINSILKSLDSRLVQLRKETDVDYLKTMVNKKADNEQVQNELFSQEQKIEKLDQNLIAIVNDLKRFQTTINTMYVSVADLQEVNKDILLGKK